MTTTDLSLRDRHELDALETIRASLASIDDLSQAKEATDQAAAISAYAKAKNSEELVNRAVALRIWTERRAGELAMESRATYTDLARDHGIRPAMFNRWMCWANAEKELLDQIIEELSDSGSLSLQAAQRRVYDATRKSIARGITRLLDGRYTLSWSWNGRRYSKTVSCRNDDDARLRLKHESSFYERPKIGTADIRVAYSLCRKALAHCDAVLAKTSGEARRDLEEAMKHLYKAEDALTSASKKNEMHGTSRRVPKEAA